MSIFDKRPMPTDGMFMTPEETFYRFSTPRSDSVKGNIEVKDWLLRCDNVLLHEIGESVGQYSHVDWESMYDKGLTPREAVEVIIKNLNLKVLNLED